MERSGRTATCSPRAASSPLSSSSLAVITRSLSVQTAYYFDVYLVRLGGVLALLPEGRPDRLRVCRGVRPAGGRPTCRRGSIHRLRLGAAALRAQAELPVELLLGRRGGGALLLLLRIPGKQKATFVCKF